MTPQTFRASLIAVGTFVALPGPIASAAVTLSADADIVLINSISASTCGTQSMTFSGTGTYSEPTQHLVVTLDGTEILHSHLEPDTWATDAVLVSPGSHTLKTTIYDDLSHADTKASQTAPFTVNACGAAPPTPTPAPAAGASGGTDLDQDCCPGPDPVVPAPKTSVQKAQVKGAAAVRSTAKLPPRLDPINSLFRTVYGRAPTFAEWEYWARRQWNDKPQYDALYGAMQWHELRGHTTGGPKPILLK